MCANPVRQTDAMLKIVIRLSQRRIVGLTRNLVGEKSATASHADTRHVTKMANFKNSRWRMAVILKIVFTARRYAYRKRGLCCRPVSMRLSVCLSRSCLVLLNFFLGPVAPSI